MFLNFRYTCRTCGYSHEQSERENTLFMAEWHALENKHYDGVLKKVDYPDLMPHVIYTKHARYLGNKWVISNK